MNGLLITLCILTILHLATQECLEGCLKCNTKDECQFCDGTNKYILDVITCKSIKIANCVTISTTGNCIVCDTGYYIDQATLKCMQITTETQVANCSVYASAKVCAVCNKGFFVKESACVAVPTPIQNCINTNSANLTKCDECDKGYLLSLDKIQCNQVEVIENCAGYTTLMCRSCQPEYIKDNNIYLEQIYQFTDEAAKFVVLKSLINDTNVFVDQGVFNVCKKKMVDNCLTFEKFNECKECKTGYILNSDKQCDTYPDEEIPNCFKYSSATSCVECKTGFHLETGVCVADTVISNCLHYSGTASATTCIQCAADFYLSDKTCKSRTVNSTFDNCTQRKINADFCEACSDVYMVTTDGLACLPKLANCKSYKDSTKAADKHTCDTCMAKYYYKEADQACASGNSANCDIYQRTANTCQICINQYYLGSDNLCKKHDALDGCVSYSNTKPKTCVQCDKVSMLFTQENACVAKEEDIPNCIEYASSTQCKTCKEGYDITISSKCAEITSPSFCLVRRSNKCAKCLPSYYIDAVGNCVIIEAYFNLYCQSHNVNGTRSYLDYDCNHCTSGAIPYNYKSSYVCTNALNISTIIPDCLKYYAVTVDNITTHKCAMCDNNKVVTASGACSTSCSPSEAQVVMGGFNVNSVSATNYDGYSVTTNNICRSVSGSNFDNCSHLYPDLFSHTQTTGEFAYWCAACKSGYEKVIIQDTAIITNNPSTNLYGSSPVDSYPGVSCEVSSSITNGTDSTVISNCEYYYEYSADHFGCYRCKFGYSGVVTTQGYIVSCTELTTCDTTSEISSGLITSKVNLQTLHTVWTSLFSCYKCKAADQIPFVAINFATRTKYPMLEAFVANPTSGAYNTGTGGKAVDCYELRFSSFGISPSTNYNFPAHCALGVINTAKSPNSIDASIKEPGTNNASIFCVACKAGYRPLYTTNDTGLLMIYSCEQINTTKCSSSTWFNTCSACSPGHTYSYDSVKKIVNFDTCEAFTDENCYAVSTADPINFECVYCKKGFTLNVDKKCERINSNKCVGNQFNLEIKYNATFDNDQHAIGIILSPNGAGCQRCESGYLAILETNSEYYCTASSYVNGGSYTTVTKMINKCTNYYMSDNGSLICKVCAADYILNTDHKCVVASEYPDCDIARSTSGCSTCKSGFVNIASSCQQKAIDRCIVYNEGPLIASQTCLQCEPEYYPSTNQCVKGAVAYCSLLISQYECTQCQTGYALVTSKSSKSYCYPIEPKLKCVSLSDQLNLGKVECTKCVDGYALSTASSDRNDTICFPFQSIVQCTNYEYTAEIATSTFNCLKCNEGFFVDTAFSCKARTVTHKKCEEYDTSQDKCKICASGYYVASSGLCKEYPSGIKGCRIYKNKSTCTDCVTGAFLGNNKCSFIDASKLIANCVYYESDKVCKTCTAGFAASEGKCVQAQAKNCLTYSTPTKCDSCNPDYGFKDESGIRNCVEKQVSRCVTSEDYSPFKCLICATEFYPNDGVCSEVAATIEGCTIYDTKDTCSQCQTGRTLSADAKTCSNDNTLVSLVDPFCSISYISSKNKCVKCNKGYILDNSNICKACTASTLADGCYVCNPYDESKCTLCAPGFYQTKDAVCKPNVSKPDTSGGDGDGGTDGGNGDGDGTSGVWISMVVTSLMLIVLHL